MVVVGPIAGTAEHVVHQRDRAAGELGFEAVFRLSSGWAVDDRVDVGEDRLAVSIVAGVVEPGTDDLDVRKLVAELLFFRLVVLGPGERGVRLPIVDRAVAASARVAPADRLGERLLDLVATPLRVGGRRR